ncbi:hypothetical protein ACFOLB_12200 [Microbacterium aurantiacum]
MSTRSGHLIDLLLLWRNRETVHRLALLAEGRARSRGEGPVHTGA